MAKLRRITLDFLWLLPAFIVLAAILVLQPGFGLMDDSNHLYNLVPAIRKLGLWEANLAYLKEDLSLGVFRITYPPMVAALYGVAGFGSPITLFLLNWVWVIAVLAGFAAFCRHLYRLSFLSCFGISFLFFFFYDYFQHPSLQEKMLFPFGVALLAACMPDFRLSVVWRVLLIAAATALGSSTKTSFVIFFAPATICLFWHCFVKRSLPRYIFAISFLQFIGWTALLAYLARQGTYGASQYDFKKVLPNILSFNFLYLAVPACLPLVFFRKGWARHGIHLFLPVMVLGAFLLVFLPWGIEAYITILILPFLGLGLLLAIGLSGIEGAKKAACILLLISLSCTQALYRSYRSFTRLGDLHVMLKAFSGSHKLDGLPLFANSSEGADSMTRYFDLYGRGDLKVRQWPGEASGAFVLLGDSAFCPLPAVACEGAELFSGRFPGSFKAVRYQCGQEGLK